MDKMFRRKRRIYKNFMNKIFRKKKKSGINVQRENGHADVLVKTPKSSTYVGRYQH